MYMYQFDQNEDFSHTHNSGSKGEWLFCHYLEQCLTEENITTIIRDFLRIYLKLLHLDIKGTKFK